MVILALAVTVAIGIFRSASTPVESVPLDANIEDPRSTEVIYVHVSGEVAAPGLYILDGDARVVDAIAAAEGFSELADQDAVNLARPLGDGEQLLVPKEGAASEGSAPVGDGRINLNTADASALDSLPRIGEAMAARIIDWRESNGGFTSVEDLLAVPGIGDKMLDALRDLVTV